MTSFKSPWQYSFPPFFTIQPNLDTRKKQLESWRSLILNYCRSNKMYVFDVEEISSSAPFFNSEINRRLSLDDMHTVLEYLRQNGNLEWLDKQHRRCYIYWRTPAEWGKLIYSWISNNGMNNTVCTLYEITNGDNSVDEEFHNLDSGILLRALQTLELEKKAELFSADGSDGVKFF